MGNSSSHSKDSGIRRRNTGNNMDASYSRDNSNRKQKGLKTTAGVSSK